jgi:ornithine--oxo-acid transaminase
VIVRTSPNHPHAPSNTPSNAPFEPIDVAGAVARNYAPLPVRLVEGSGVWVRDERGNRYLDMLAAYSALNFGHRHPRLVAAAHRQLDRLTLTSRAFSDDQLGPFCQSLAALCGKQAVLPMNTGAEAVETAIKVARRWGYERKAVAADQAKIVVFDGNFHGRTTTIVGFSSDASARDGFGPFAPGFERVPFGDVAAVERVCDANTVAVLVEPVQGEAGVVVPPSGFLASLRRICDDRGVLLVADEIQSGLCRTGRTFACDHEHVRPDVYVLGKALGGGIVALSAVVADWDVLGVLTPGSHGSTFGGNPLACAIGSEVVAMVSAGEFQHRARRLGEPFLDGLRDLSGRGVLAVRGRGLWAGIDIDPALGTGRALCEALLARGVLAKDAHERTVRLAPPLVVEPAELDFALDQLAAALSDLDGARRPERH